MNIPFKITNNKRNLDEPKPRRFCIIAVNEAVAYGTPAYLVIYFIFISFS